MTNRRDEGNKGCRGTEWMEGCEDEGDGGHDPVGRCWDSMTKWRDEGKRVWRDEGLRVEE